MTSCAREYTRAFHRIDADGSGSLDERELRAAVGAALGRRVAGRISRDEINRLFALADVDHDGALSLSEFLDGMARAARCGSDGRGAARGGGGGGRADGDAADDRETKKSKHNNNNNADDRGFADDGDGEDAAGPRRRRVSFSRHGGDGGGVGGDSARHCRRSRSAPTPR